jgi:quinol monooxygenase YgiN
MIYIATYLDVQPASTADAIQLLQRYRAGTSGESPLWIGVMEEIYRKNRFVIIEAWKDEEALEAHERAEKTSRFRSDLKAIHNSPYDRRVHLGFSVGPDPTPAGRDAICAVTHVDVPPPRREDAENLLRGLADPSRKDEGNVRYDIFQQLAPRTNHFTVFAVWKSTEAFDAHEAKPHTRAFREALGPMLGAPYDERLYLPL